MNQYKVCVSVKKTKNTLSNTISLKTYVFSVNGSELSLCMYD